MKEAFFLKQHAQKWKNFESMLKSRKVNPDELAEHYIQLTDDLSYAQTYYPGTTTAAYLNSLASQVHQLIYKNRKEDSNRFVQFWKSELPLLTRKYHKQFLYSLTIFLISAGIGALSARFDEDYVRLILGDAYVNLTLENIEKGDPLGIYKEEDGILMFFKITLNNIQVSFNTFALGLLASVGTVFMLFTNGVMLGSFQYFFFAEGLLKSSLLTIWIHGTLEISAIIIAGAAGMVMGNSILFPGTYSRLDSFKRGSKDGMKIALGLVPVFITAGFLESFVTRHTEWPDAVRLSIILISASFILFYFVFYPHFLHKKLYGKYH